MRMKQNFLSILFFFFFFFTVPCELDCALTTVYALHSLNHKQQNGMWESQKKKKKEEKKKVKGRCQSRSCATGGEEGKKRL